MSVRIREDRCIGCGRCTEVCPGNLIRMLERTDAPVSGKLKSGNASMPEELQSEDGTTSVVSRSKSGSASEILSLEDRSAYGTVTSKSTSRNGIKLSRKIAHMKHPEDCWGCTSCIKECPAGAIEFFLGADIGGRGTILSVKKTQAGWDWSFRHPDGTEETIAINAKAANKY